MRAYQWTLSLLPPCLTAFTSLTTHCPQVVELHLSAPIIAKPQPAEPHASKTSPSRKEIVLLNQRRLKGLNTRGDWENTLHFLGECYPHLTLSPIVLNEVKTNATIWTEEALLDILYGNNTDNCSLGDGAVIVDGRFVTSILDRIRNSCNAVVPIAFYMLKLSVDGVWHNRRVIRSIALDQPATDVTSSQDNNELRKIYKAVFSLLGHSNNMSDSTCIRLIRNLVQDHMTSVAQIQPGTEIYHAILNALGRCGESSEIMNILHQMEQALTNKTALSNDGTSTNQYPPVDQMAYQTAISSLSKHGNVDTAISILYRMKSNGFLPDANCYNVILIGIAKEAGRVQYESGDGKWHQVALQILQDMKKQNLQPKEQAYNSVIAACGKENAWGAAAVVEQMEKVSVGDFSSALADECINTTDNASIQKDYSSHNHLTEYFTHLERYKKFGKGADSYWEVGHYKRNNASTIRIGIQPHRNPIRNGLSLVFYDEQTGVKLGRLLLKNDTSRRPNSQHDTLLYSSIVGMEVNKSLRGQGLSKVIVAIWLKMCLATNSYPRAALMNKPLISLVLMQFGFVPQEGGTCCQLVRLNSETKQHIYKNKGYSPTFGLYSISKKSLQGIFSERVLRSQNIALLNRGVTLSEQDKSSTIYIKTTFEHPIAIVDKAVDYKPPSELTKELKHVMQCIKEDDQVSTLEALDDQLQSILQTGQLEFLGSENDLQIAFTMLIT